MKLKTLVVIVVVLAALSVAAHFLTRLPAPSVDPRVGQSIVNRATVEQAAQLRLTGNGTTVLLARQPDASWRVASYYGLPVDFAKLSHFASDLAGAKIQRFVTANPDRLGRLEFGQQTIALLDAAGHEFWSLTLGKRAEAGGCFVHFDAEQKAYLASLDPWIDSAAKDWVDSTLLNFEPADVAKIEFGFDNAASVVASCAKAGDPFTAAATPAGQKLATDKIFLLLSQLAGLHFSDTSDLADPNAVAAKRHARTVKLTTFGGKTYTLAIGRKPEENISKLAAKSPAAGAGQKSTAPELETIPAGPAYAFISCSDASAPVNALMKRRACQINDFVYVCVPQKPGDLFVPAQPPVAASAVK